MTGLDGPTGRVHWTYKATPRASVSLLDPGDDARLPLVVTAETDRRPAGRSCPRRRPATTNPRPALRVPAGLIPDDPRWTRPLPWTGPIARVASPTWVFTVIGLALVNVVLPIALLRLAARRRPWTLRLLMMLPVAAAVPLCAYLAVEPLMPAQVAPLPPYPKLLFALATVAGIPVVMLVSLAGWSLLRLRWNSLVLLVGLTLLASAIIAAAWLRYDSLRHAFARELRPHGLVPGPGAGRVRRGLADPDRMAVTEGVPMAETASTTRDRDDVIGRGARRMVLLESPTRVESQSAPRR